MCVRGANVLELLRERQICHRCREKTFSVGDDVVYLKFGSVGRGEGEFRFDDLVFRKE